MSEDRSADFCRLTPGNFERFLVSDDILVHYFNDFLSQPCFPEAVVYNQATGLFEAMRGEAKMVLNRIRTALNHIRSALHTNDSTVLRIPTVDNQYTIHCLHREEGIQWIKRERLPFFLQSDFYHEYRLITFLLQWNPKFNFSRGGSSSEAKLSTPQLCSPQSEKDSQQSLKVCFQKPISPEKGPVRLHSTTNFSSLQKKCDPSECYSSSSAPERRNFSSLSSADFYSSHSISDETHKSETGPSAVEEKQQDRKVSSDQIPVLDCLEEQLEELAAKAFKEVLEPATNLITQTQANTPESFSLPGDQTNYCSSEKPRECQLYQVSEKANRESLVGRNDLYQDVNRASDSAREPRWDVSYYGDWIRLDDFKEFLQGTPGEKLVNLWIDIERVKVINTSARKSRYLIWMRSWYLSKCGHSNLSVELLSRLGLTTSPCWTEERLHSVQPYLSQSLLSYWAPRFCTSLFQQPSDATLFGGFHPDHDSKTQCFHLCPDNTCFMQTTHVHQSQMPYSAGELKSSWQMEEMLQVLCGDCCSGSYFTHFCEQSGNQLWVNAVYFWTDLQHYRALFYRDGLDLYRVQREAQLLVFTYISGCAERSLLVDEQAHRKVCDRLLPAFEELFDEVEEHALNILLEPWALLYNRENESFQQVCVQQEVRCINNQDFKDLQSLYDEYVKQQKRVQHASTSFSMCSSASVPWSSVSPDSHGYHLGAMLLPNQEIGHLKSFLQTQDASIHLACWLDLEQYKGTPVRDQAIREELSTSITKKYLNNTYFFGPDSPATTEQQEDIVHLAGGLEHLKMECLSNLVAMEISVIVKAYIEKTWLPLFVSTPEFTERQKHNPKQLLAADRPSHYVHHRRRRRREAWKVEGLWMSSSEEILLFRQALLDPVTCQQFQHFVSLKGNFLENDLLFWLEVQRYKDLCHSHSDEATIQQKISTIISCFINSSISPALQIDIPPEQAQHIMEKRDQLGPYIFREAQISVFGELLRLWPEFEEFRSSMDEEQLLPVLEDQRVKFRARVRRQRRKEEEKEERKVQEHLKRQESRKGEDETEDEDTEEFQEKGGVQPMLWSYSRYMAALQREERHNQLETCSTLSGSSHDCSIKSFFSKMSTRQSSQSSSKSTAGSKKFNRPNNSGKSSKQVTTSNVSLLSQTLSGGGGER